MSGRRNALLAGPLLLAISCLSNLGMPADAAARAKLLEDEDSAADTRPSDGRRVRASLDDDDVDVRADVRRGRDRDADDDRDRDDDRRSYNDRNEWFRDPGYYGYGNFPTVEVHDAVVANARAATARAIFRRAENALNSAVRRAVRTFENSDELRDAQQAEKAAYEQYAAARRRALQTVLEDPKYRAIMALRADLTDQMNYKRANRSYDDRTDAQITDDVVAMATLKMNYAADARAMEQTALETNNEHKDAQTKLRAAADKVAELKTDFDDALRNDRDLLAARRNLEDARIARLTASAYLDGAVDAATEALDFAYYLNRYSRYNGAGYQDYRDYYPYSSYAR